MEEDKYYLPNIEDFHIGYEYEYYIIGDWQKVCFHPSNIAYCEEWMKNLESKLIRVPYLTKEQIENEGWINITYNFQELPLFVGEKRGENYYKLTYNYWNHLLAIIDIEDNYLFSGECKSINELHYICKLLNI